MNRWLLLVASVLLTAFALLGGIARSQTTTYTYDALGRLKTSSTTGGYNDGQQTSFSYDAAGNRTNVTSNESPNASQVSIAAANAT